MKKLAMAALPFLAILLMPTPVGLPRAGQGIIAVLALAVVVWVSQAVSFEGATKGAKTSAM